MRLFVQHADRTVVVALCDGATLTELLDKCKAKFDLTSPISLKLDVDGAPVIEGVDEVCDGDRLNVSIPTPSLIDITSETLESGDVLGAEDLEGEDSVEHTSKQAKTVCVLASTEPVVDSMPVDAIPKSLPEEDDSCSCPFERMELSLPADHTKVMCEHGVSSRTFLVANTATECGGQYNNERRHVVQRDDGVLFKVKCKTARVLLAGPQAGEAEFFRAIQAVKQGGIVAKRKLLEATGVGKPTRTPPPVKDLMSHPGSRCIAQPTSHLMHNMASLPWKRDLVVPSVCKFPATNRPITMADLPPRLKEVMRPYMHIKGVDDKGVQLYRHVSCYKGNSNGTSYQVQIHIPPLGLVYLARVVDPELGGLLAAAVQYDRSRLYFRESLYAWLLWMIETGDAAVDEWLSSIDQHASALCLMSLRKTCGASSFDS